jgi:hypothetical protein
VVVSLAFGIPIATFVFSLRWAISRFGEGPVGSVGIVLWVLTLSWIVCVELRRMYDEEKNVCVTTRR